MCKNNFFVYYFIEINTFWGKFIFKTILHFAIEENNLELVKFLIKSEVFDITSKSLFQGISQLIFFYSTALNYACLKGNLDIIKYLISLNIYDIKSNDISFFFIHRVFINLYFNDINNIYFF